MSGHPQRLPKGSYLHKGVYFSPFTRFHLSALDWLVTPKGIEPLYCGPKPHVLPLNYRVVWLPWCAFTKRRGSLRLYHELLPGEAFQENYYHCYC